MSVVQLLCSRLVVYSQDQRVKDVITRNKPVASGQDVMLGPVEFRSELNGIVDKSAGDVFVYDLDIANDDIGQAKLDILSLTRGIPSMPLLLIGARTQISSLLESKEVSTAVATSISKPVGGSQLLIAIKLIVGNRVPAVASHHREKANMGSVLFGIIALAFIVLGSALVFFKETPQKMELRKESLPPKVAAEKAFKTLPSSISDHEVDNSEVVRLSKLASTALEEHRLVSTNGDDALTYFNRILEIDSYDENAYKNKWIIITELRSSFKGMLDNNEFETAQITLTTLTRNEPFNDQNWKMVLELEAAELKSSQRLGGNESFGLVSPQR